MSLFSTIRCHLFTENFKALQAQVVNVKSTLESQRNTLEGELDDKIKSVNGTCESISMLQGKMNEDITALQTDVSSFENKPR